MNSYLVDKIKLFPIHSIPCWHVNTLFLVNIQYNFVLLLPKFHTLYNNGNKERNAGGGLSILLQEKKKGYVILDQTHNVQ